MKTSISFLSGIILFILLFEAHSNDSIQLHFTDTVYTGNYYEKSLFDESVNIEQLKISAYGLPQGLILTQEGVLMGTCYGLGHFKPIVEIDDQGRANKEEISLSVVRNKALADYFLNHLQIFPNPFIDGLKIEFEINQPAKIKIDVFAKNGEQIINLVEKPYHEGHQVIYWNGTNENGQSIETGWYYIQFHLEDEDEEGVALLNEIRKVLKVRHKGMSMW